MTGVFNVLHKVFVAHERVQLFAVCDRDRTTNDYEILLYNFFL